MEAFQDPNPLPVWSPPVDRPYPNLTPTTILIVCCPMTLFCWCLFHYHRPIIVQTRLVTGFPLCTLPFPTFLFSVYSATLDGTQTEQGVVGGDHYLGTGTDRWFSPNSWSTLPAEPTILRPLEPLKPPFYIPTHPHYPRQGRQMRLLPTDLLPSGLSLSLCIISYSSQAWGFAGGQADGLADGWR